MLQGVRKAPALDPWAPNSLKVGPLVSVRFGPTAGFVYILGALRRDGIRNSLGCWKEQERIGDFIAYAAQGKLEQMEAMLRSAVVALASGRRC